MCVMQYTASGRWTNYLTIIETEAYSKHCQTFKIERFSNRIMPECRHATRNISGQWRFPETRRLR